MLTWILSPLNWSSSTGNAAVYPTLATSTFFWTQQLTASGADTKTPFFGLGRAPLEPSDLNLQPALLTLWYQRYHISILPHFWREGSSTFANHLCYLNSHH